MSFYWKTQAEGEGPLGWPGGEQKMNLKHKEESLLRQKGWQRIGLICINTKLNIPVRIKSY